MMPLISVIIPIYNVANYLSASLESVVNQTYTNIEIILVNDGSTDNSVDIIKEFAAKDLRIVVVDKKNEGVVIARKAGLSIAIGEYIHYLDGDDYLDVDAYEILNSHLSEDY